MTVMYFKKIQNFLAVQNHIICGFFPQVVVIICYLFIVLNISQTLISLLKPLGSNL